MSENKINMLNLVLHDTGFKEKSPGRVVDEKASTFPVCTYVTKPNLGLLTHCAAKPIYSCKVVVKESTALMCRAPNTEYRQLMFERPELLDDFQGKFFKGNIWGEG